MKNFCLDLREQVTKIINYEKKEIMSLSKKEEKLHNKQKFVIYAKKDLVLITATKITLK